MSEVDDLTEELLRFLQNDNSPEGVPLPVVKKHLQNWADSNDIDDNEERIRSVIQEQLDQWRIDKTIAYVEEGLEIELELPLGKPVWHLKFLSPEEQTFYRSLNDVQKATILTLRNQNDPDRLGEMPQDALKEALRKQGLDPGDTLVTIDDVVEEFFSDWNGEDALWIGLVEEYKKTDEYRQHLEEMMDKAEAKEARMMRLADEDFVIGPIYEHLEKTDAKRMDDLGDLYDIRDELSEEEYQKRKIEIETRDVDEENFWRSVLDVVPDISYSDLRGLIRIFDQDQLPDKEKIKEFLNNIDRPLAERD